MKIFKVCLALLLLPMVGVMDACWNSGEKVCLSKVTDMKGNGNHVWNLEYDASRRLVRYGNTPISYGNNQITVGEMDWESKEEHMYHATFHVKENGTLESESLCRLPVKDEMVDARKKSSYRETPDTLFVFSNYYVEGVENPVRQVEAKYAFDTHNRLTDVVSTYSGRESCHTDTLVFSCNRDEFARLMSEFLLFKIFGNHIDPSRISHKDHIVCQFLWAQMQMEY